ncbi:MAG TPA: hypothetical protein DCP28_04980 [Cytophagales bacterium]|nr:hypothetical protein [Cytophagales bacterium]
MSIENERNLTQAKFSLVRRKFYLISSSILFIWKYSSFFALANGRKRSSILQIKDTMEPKTLPKTHDSDLVNYRITAPIGEGGYDIVYKAKQLSTDRTVALKKLKAREDIDEATKAKPSTGLLKPMAARVPPHSHSTLRAFCGYRYREPTGKS